MHSDLAVSCPECGRPVLQSAKKRQPENTVITTQVTSKKIKLQSLYGAFIILAGIVIAVLSLSTGNEKAITVGVWIAILCFIVGLIFMIITKIQKWWHHE